MTSSPSPGASVPAGDPEAEGALGAPGSAPPPVPAGEPALEGALGSPPPPRRRRGYWIPGLIALTVLLALALAFGAGDLDHGSPTVLHGSDVDQEIAIGIQVQQGTHTLPDVRCPTSEPVRAGYRFVCTTDQAGPSRHIQVVEIDGRGHLRWQLGP